MTQNEFDGMLLKASGVICAGLAGLWGFFKTFATQKDLDALVTRVSDLEDDLTKSQVATARLETAVTGLERAVRDLTRFLRQQAPQPGLSCAITYPPHNPFDLQESDGE